MPVFLGTPLIISVLSIYTNDYTEASEMGIETKLSLAWFRNLSNLGISLSYSEAVFDLFSYSLLHIQTLWSRMDTNIDPLFGSKTTLVSIQFPSVVY